MPSESLVWFTPTSKVIFSLKVPLASWNNQLFPPLCYHSPCVIPFASKLNFSQLRTMIYPPQCLVSSSTAQSTHHLFREWPHQDMHPKCPSLNMCWRWGLLSLASPFSIKIPPIFHSSTHMSSPLWSFSFISLTDPLPSPRGPQWYGRRAWNTKNKCIQGSIRNDAWKSRLCSLKPGNSLTSPRLLRSSPKLCGSLCHGYRTKGLTYNWRSTLILTKNRK